ncbi:DEAD/DEAH box helicase family protein [Paenibacillus barcinonensis]|uniref:DEAD/DEAH box helicase n=1 Tax=Paenibacillus barcinonensis TaxID=198119 RepID=UPI001C11F154|nr:DEAD/DEAH box helicase family protein [Paenibacillus barcinonensis]MBU5355202.1 DEAD/DEAH box helicase family protein [Paenibacillus barcinonensis]
MSNGVSYFKNVNAFIEGNISLRDPQRIAHRRLKESFESDPDSHKIIVLPTGTGKTGTMGLAPYEISDGKVLIITPGKVIREGVSDEFDTRTPFNFWTKRNVILDDTKLPNVYRYAGYQTAPDRRRIMGYLNNADVVVANIHKVYSSTSRKALVNILDADYFDMIIIDEAHHSAADSWLKTLKHFNAKKIVKLTATPIRGDDKEIDGEIIYKYELADAIKEGLVKNIVAEDYTTEKLEFLVDGKLVDKEIALEAMDKKWVTRSVAYSAACNRTIVEMSLRRLNEKRRQGLTHHQIIAVACDIEHAKEVKVLYEEYGLNAAVVSSDDPEDAEDVIIEYKKGQLDVVVNVNMLGEGFDHSNISIAAIFRPFRTLAPYAQFIGRALRRIPEGNDAIDNIAHVVYHTELGLDDLWTFYTGQRTKAERKKVLEFEYYREQGKKQDRDVGEVNAHGKVVVNTKEFLADGVASIYQDEIRESIRLQELKIQNVADMMKAAGHSESEINEYKASQKRSLDSEITEKRNKLREELIREELHKIHKEDIVNRVEELFVETGIHPKGNELPNRTTSVFLKNSGTNDAYVIKYINSSLKNRIKRGIDEWEAYDFEQARTLLPQIIQAIHKKIRNLGG